MQRSFQLCDAFRFDSTVVINVGLFIDIIPKVNFFLFRS